MDVRVELHWFDGEPSLVVNDTADGTIVLVDPRLSDQQIAAACIELNDVGPAVRRSWQVLVGINPEGVPAR